MPPPLFSPIDKAKFTSADKCVVAILWFFHPLIIGLKNIYSYWGVKLMVAEAGLMMYSELF